MKGSKGRVRETIKSYDEHAVEYADESNKRGARTDDVNRICTLVKVENPLIVELGCANGRDAAVFLKRSVRYLGMDGSEQLIAIARQTVPGGQFVVADYEDFEFPESVDAVIAFASLLHADRKTMKGILSRAAAALNHRGIIYLSMQFGEYKEELRDDNMGIRNFYYYTPELIEELAPDDFQREYLSIEQLRSKKWFELVLRKV